MDDDGVEGILRQREVVDVALAHAAMPEPGAVEPGAGERQHVEGQVEAEAALDLRAEQLEHAPGAGAEIEQRADLAAGERAADRLLHRLVRDMKLADAVPLGGVAAEIGLRGGVALRAHRGQPLAIACQRRVGGIEARNQLARQLGRPAALAQAEERPGPFPEAIDQPGLGQEPQMPRNARLRLAQDGGEIGDGELGLASSARMRSRVASPAAFSALLTASNGRWAEAGIEWATFPFWTELAALRRAYKDIFIPLTGSNSREWASFRHGRRLRDRVSSEPRLKSERP